MTRPARARVVGRFDQASRVQEATVTIDRAGGLFSVKPLRRRRSYTLPLAKVAEIVCQRVILAELAEKRRLKREAKKAKRG